MKKLVVCINGNYGLMCVDIEKMLKVKMEPITMLKDLNNKIENKQNESYNFFELLELMDFRDEFCYK